MKVFERYIDSFKLVYSSTKKEIKILEKGKTIGKFLILFDAKKDQSILKLKFYKKFYKTYNNSRQFFYKFGEGIIKKLLVKNEFKFTKNLVLKLNQ